MSVTERQAGCRTMSLALSPLGLAAWYLISGLQDLAIRSANGFPGATENCLLIIAGCLSLLAAVLLAAATVRMVEWLLTIVLLIGIVLVVAELAAFVIVYSSSPSGLSVDLKVALALHIFLVWAVYAHCAAQSCLRAIRNV